MQARIVVATAAVLLALGAGPAWAAKIGYVDLQRAINEVDEGQAAKAKLKKDFEEKQKVLDQRQESLKQLKGSIEAAAGSKVITDEARQAQAKEFQQQLMELQKVYVDLQQELTRAEAEAMKDIVAKMRGIINALGKRDEYEYILDSSAIIYGPQHMDITNEVIRLYNDKAGSKPTAATPKKGKKDE